MNELLLHTHLAMAVPLRIHELRDQPDSALDKIRADLPDRLQQGADAMQFGGGNRGEIGRSIGAWTTGLALMALQAEGGIDFQGMHWCAIPNCRAGSRFEHAVGTEPDDPPDLAAWGG